MIVYQSKTSTWNGFSLSTQCRGQGWADSPSASFKTCVWSPKTYTQCHFTVKHKFALVLSDEYDVQELRPNLGLPVLKLKASQTNGEKKLLHIFFRNHVLELSWDHCTTKEGQQSLVVLTRSYWALLAFLCNDSIMILHDMLGRFSRVLLVWIPTMNLINALAMNFTHRWRRARPVIRFLLPFYKGVYLVITSRREGIDWCVSSRSFVFVFTFFLITWLKAAI